MNPFGKAVVPDPKRLSNHAKSGGASRGDGTVKCQRIHAFLSLHSVNANHRRFARKFDRRYDRIDLFSIEIALELALDSHSSTSRSVLRSSRSANRRAERQPGATRVGPRIDPIVRNSKVRIWSGPRSVSGKRSRIDFFGYPSPIRPTNFTRHSAKNGQTHKTMSVRTETYATSGVYKIGLRATMIDAGFALSDIL
jgi:hypothetical protein